MRNHDVTARFGWSAVPFWPGGASFKISLTDEGFIPTDLGGSEWGHPDQAISVILPGGHELLFDACDIQLVAGFRWRAVRDTRCVYALSSQGKKLLGMHQIILGKRPPLVIDHINGNGLDNRRANLRHVTQSINASNQHNKREGTTSRYIGVYKRPDSKSTVWRTEIEIMGVRYRCGSFSTEEGAYAAVQDVRRAYVEHGTLPNRIGYKTSQSKKREG